MPTLRQAIEYKKSHSNSMQQRSRLGAIQQYRRPYDHGQNEYRIIATCIETIRESTPVNRNILGGNKAKGKKYPPIYFGTSGPYDPEGDPSPLQVLRHPPIFSFPEPGIFIFCSNFPKESLPNPWFCGSDPEHIFRRVNLSDHEFSGSEPEMLGTRTRDFWKVNLSEHDFSQYTKMSHFGI